MQPGACELTKGTTMTKKIAEKSTRIDMSKFDSQSEPQTSADAPSAAPAVFERPAREIIPGMRRPVTGVGNVMDSISNAKHYQQQLEKAESKLKEFEGAAVVRALDPASICPSRWANR